MAPQSFLPALPVPLWAHVGEAAGDDLARRAFAARTAEDLDELVEYATVRHEGLMRALAVASRGPFPVEVPNRVSALLKGLPPTLEKRFLDATASWADVGSRILRALEGAPEGSLVAANHELRTDPYAALGALDTPRNLRRALIAASEGAAASYALVRGLDLGLKPRRRKTLEELVGYADRVPPLLEAALTDPGTTYELPPLTEAQRQHRDRHGWVARFRDAALPSGLGERARS